MVLGFAFRDIHVRPVGSHSSSDSLADHVNVEMESFWCGRELLRGRLPK